MNLTLFTLNWKKNDFFSSLMKRRNNYINDKTDKEKKDYEDFNEKIIKIFMNQFKLDNKLVENRNINIDIFFYFNLPLKTFLNEIHDFIQKNVVEKYEKNENFFRNIYLEEDNNCSNEKSLYINNLLNINTFTENSFHNFEIIKKIELEPKEIKNKFYNLFFDDYLSFIIINNFNEEIYEIKRDIKSFMELIINIKFKIKREEVNNLNISIKIINWLETYFVEDIIPMINFLLMLKWCDIKDIFPNLKTFMNDIVLNIDKISNIKENEKIVNSPFYIIILVLIRIFIFNFSNTIDRIMEIQSMKNLIDNLVKNLESLKYVNNILNLNCNDLFLFEELVKIMKFIFSGEDGKDLVNKKKLLLDFSNVYLIKDKFYDNKNKINNEENNTKLNMDDYLNRFMNLFEKNKTENSEKLLSSILIDEFKKESNEDNKKHILKIILDNENLIKNNLLFLMENIYSTVKQNIDAIDDISNNGEYFPLFNQSENSEETIIKIFDIIINIYFDSLQNLDDFNTKLFEIFKKYLNVLSNDKYEDYYKGYYNENLLKLFSLSYLKIYLIRYTKLILENRNALRGKENDIISEILKTGSFKNTLLTYFIILLYNKMEKKDIFGFLKENYIEVSRFYNELKENVGKIEFEEILKTSKIPREETFLFSEYFNHFEFVSIDNFKEQLLSSNNNKKKYPLLWSYITDENVKNLKYLLDYNDFVNFMKNNYSGKISRKDAKDVNLSEKEIYQNREFQKKLDKFKYIFNEILFFEEKDKINENDKLACFLIDDIKNENGIKIKKGFDKFIKWQNSFLKPIIESKGNINLNYYKSSLKLETDVQKVNKSKIILIDECFKNTPFVNFRGLITLYSKNHDQDKNKFDYDFEKIEEELSKILLPQKCLFNEKNFDYVIYQFESANTNNDYLINFQKKYGAENLDENDKKTLYKYFKENYNYYSIFDEQFIILLNYLANNSKKLKEDSIYDCIIEPKKKPVNFHNIFESFFSKEGKEITISKLLE